MRDLWLYGHEVELSEMLEGRERRVNRQMHLLKEAEGASLICFTLNMAGPVKVCAASDIAFEIGIKSIENKIDGIIKKEIYKNSYGHEAFYLVLGEPAEIKKMMCEIEDSTHIGRLFDIDVLRADGTKVSRTELGLSPRRCLICDKEAMQCASTRAHSVKELQNAFLDIVIKHKDEQTKTDEIVISKLAYHAMITEVMTTPKPGLVDQNNNGSHHDMNIAMFCKSAETIEEYFGRCFIAGKNAASLNYPELFKKIQTLGIKAEEEMMQSTSGVNTHKGLIYSLGVLCTCLGILGKRQKYDSIKTIAEQLTIKKTDEKNADGQLHAGARAEVAAGYPSVFNIAIPTFEKARKLGYNINEAGIYCLLCIIATIDDTNMLRRGGEQTASHMRKCAADIIAVATSPKNGIIKSETFIGMVEELDSAFIKDNISPGGAADILAITYFIEMYKEVLDNQ